MRDLLHDVRFALRTLAKTPTFTILAIITIALGVGANTAAFSMVHGVLLRRLPYAANDRLVRIEQPSATNPDARFSVLEIADYRAQMKSLAGIAEYHSMPFQLYGSGEPQRVQTGVVSDDFFNLLGVQPILGRSFLPGEEAVGAPPVVLLSYRYWMNKMNGDPKVVGTTFTMNDKIHRVVGVLPPLPAYPNDNDIWMPAGACPFRDAVMNQRRGRMLQQFAVMKPGATIEQVRAELATVSGRLHAEYAADYPAARKLSVAVVPLTDELTAQSRPLFFTLLAAAAFVLLIAMANFANIMLARQLRRQREIALRAALGAGRARLFRQLATESLCVSLTGGLLGVGIAYSGMGLLRSLATRVTPRANEIAIDRSVLAFALAVSVVVGLIAAFAPLMRRGASLSDALRAGSATSSGTRQDGRTRGLLVGAQVAIAFVLLVGAGLMVSSLVKLERVDAGVVTTNVMSARVDLDWTRYNNPSVTADQAPLIRAFVDQLMQRLGAQPGVQAVGIASAVPLNVGRPINVAFQIRGQDVAPDRLPKADITIVSAGYFKTMGIPVLRGQTFSDAARDSTQNSVMISQRLAAANWPGKSPIGQEISLDGGTHWIPIAGIVGDVHANGLSKEISDAIYVPFETNLTTDMRVLVRTIGDPAPMGRAIRDAVHEIDAKQPVVSIETMAQVRGESLSEPRVTTALLGSFAVLALVITAAGLAGVIAYGVSQRLNEIGIRMALGAEAPSVVWLVMRQGLALAAAGLVVGAVMSIWATRLMQKLLFDTAATDVPTFALVGTLLLLIAAAACWMPARRALQVEPVQALRPR
jgi:putative ABC transport system permease protein